MNIIIDSTSDGMTVKEWLYRNGISRGLITKLKQLPDGITVNGGHVTVRAVLHTGDTLSLAVTDTETDCNPDLIPTEMPLDILYEDDAMIAVNKPAGIPTHPSLGHFEDTLANGLAYYFKSQNRPFIFRAVNRLDRNTSGVVLVAKNRYASAQLTTLMNTGKIRKTYLAILNGTLTPPSGWIRLAIRRRTESVIFREVSDLPDAKEAVTAYRTLWTSVGNAVFDDAVAADAVKRSAIAADTPVQYTDTTMRYTDTTMRHTDTTMRHTDTAVNRILAENPISLVRAEPITGRTHQLRVHFAAVDAPIVGDGLYGTGEAVPTFADTQLNRHALHAAVLTVTLPNREQCFHAPLPDDMKHLLDVYAAPIDRLLPQRFS